jgi:hypothetical protein
MSSDLSQALASVVAVIQKFPAGVCRGEEIARMEALLADKVAAKSEFNVALSKAIDATKVMWHLLSYDDRKVVRYAQADLYAGIEDNGVDLDVDFDQELKAALDAYALRHNKSLNQVVQDALSMFVSGDSYFRRA